jgi:serine/threonine protein phosphatase PrpC
MGGHDAGDVASETIVSGLSGLRQHKSAMALDEDFRDRIFGANSKIRRISEERGNVVIGSTLVALLAFGEAYRCLWSGDSRAYVLRGHTLIQITRDHTEIGEIMAGRRSKEICEQLVSLALERGGTDNVTVSAIQFHTSKATIPVDSAYQVATPDPFQ